MDHAAWRKKKIWSKKYEPKLQYVNYLNAIFVVERAKKSEEDWNVKEVIQLWIGVHITAKFIPIDSIELKLELRLYHAFKKPCSFIDVAFFYKFMSR